MLCESGLTSEGVKAAEQSRAIFERLVRDHPQNPKHRRALALAHLTIGSALDFWMGRKSEAFLAYQKGADIYQRLARDHPDVVRVSEWSRRRLATTWARP